jgi:hypothetical protein
MKSAMDQTMRREMLQKVRPATQHNMRLIFHMERAVNEHIVTVYVKIQHPHFHLTL